MRTSITQSNKRRRRLLAMLLTALFAIAAFSSCLPQSSVTQKGAGQSITVYAFSVMKESLEKAICPAFSEKWRQEHGRTVQFTSSFAGSETITNQILQGVGADVGIFSIERDADRLASAGFVNSNWQTLPHRGIVNKTPFIILVRKGNPKGIHDFPDLAKPGIELIHPDPVSSGGAMWSILAIYGSELVKSEKQTGGMDQARALNLLRSVWANAKATPDSARAARTLFETGYGDALITYELEGLLMKEAGAKIEVVVPPATIFSEHPVAVIDRNVTEDERGVVNAFVQYLWSDEAQRAFVKYHFRSVTHEEFNAENPLFAKIEMPFTVELFGGWARAYPEIIEGIWRDRIQKKK
jgi:sulfate transport system substrate-binding protein